MPALEVTWTWVLESPLHLGAGLSRPGVADRLIQQDSNRNAVVRGDAIKGALRMAAEQVAAWLDQPQRYGPNADPHSWPLACLFGGDARAHFRVNWMESSGSTAVLASTSIKRSTGRATDQSLRRIEVLAPGSKINANVLVTTDTPEDLRAVATLLLAAVASTENLGGKAGIGWGRTKVQDLTLRSQVIGDTAADLMTGARLTDLAKALSESRQARAVRVVSPEPLETGEWYQLDITLLDPVCFADLPAVSNTIETEEAIGATTLRGALARAWRDAPVAEERILVWLSEKTRWSPGFPVVSGVRYLPTPRSFRVPKRSSSPLHDGLLGDEPLLDDEGDRLHFRAPRTRWIGWTTDDVRAFGAARRKEVRMHVARDYKTGGAVRGALFARESLLPEGLKFLAFVRLPKAAVAAHPADGQLSLGKRRSAGNGQATVTFTELQDKVPSDILGGEGLGNRVLVQLLSPALVRDINHGYPLKAISAAQWLALLGPSSDGVTLRSVDCVGITGPGRRGGWMSNWEHQRAAVPTVDAGSVWRLTCEDDESAARLRQLLREQGQIGERRHEGFGWIVVDPSWLGVFDAGSESPSGLNDSWAEKQRGEVRPWPGCRSPQTPELERIARDLPDLPKDQRLVLRGPLQQLATMARTMGLDRIRDHCDRMSKRKGERNPWKPLKPGERARLLLDRFWNPEEAAKAVSPMLFRFALEALLIRVTEPREQS